MHVVVVTAEARLRSCDEGPSVVERLLRELGRDPESHGGVYRATSQTMVSGALRKFPGTDAKFRH